MNSTPRWLWDAEPNCVRQAVPAKRTRLFSERTLNQVRIECAEELPEQTPGGKYREVIPLN